DPGVVAEGAVAIETNRPDQQAIGHGVVEATLMHREAEDAAFRRRIVPGRGLAAVELLFRDVQRLRIPGHWSQPLGGAPGDAMVVTPALATIQAEAVNKTGLPVGDKERFRDGIECEPAKGRP